MSSDAQDREAAASEEQAEKDRKYCKTRYNRIQKNRAAAKALYAEIDADEMAIVRRLGVGRPLDLGEVVIVVVDNFADRNVAFKPAGVKRREVKEHKGYKAA